MLFNSLNFILFFPVVFILYWFGCNKNLKIQNILLLISSYFFYACWDYRFLFLLLFSTSLDYYTGIKIYTSKKNARKLWLWISVSINLGFLGLFKYYNFFAVSLSELLSGLGFKTSLGTLNIILPLGISFYTFHGLSYVFDIYRERIKPVKSFIEYSVFVSFFPLLVAGPIERATHLLPQIQKKRHFDYSKAVNGLRQILWGLFKKVVIADNCAPNVNAMFSNSSHYPGSALVLGAFLFAIQIYCDFSGYSDIALGLARLLGIDLMRNFAFPYFSRDIAEFWRRWHISLSSWFKDYLYIPFGGSRGGLWNKVKNIFIIFIVSGFWHGANLTFIFWGLLNALYFIPVFLFNRNRRNIEIVAKGKNLPSIKDFLNISLTFTMITFAWIFFRSDTIGHALKYISGIFSTSFFILPRGGLILGGVKHLAVIMLLIIILLTIEWNGRENQFGLETTGLTWGRPLRWLFYFGIIISIFYFSGEQRQFIYFQF